MNDLLAGLLSALLSTNQTAAASNLLAKHTGIQLKIASDPLTLELKRLMDMDDQAREEIDEMLQKEQGPKPDQPEIKKLTTDTVIEKKLDAVKNAYDDFIAKHPSYAKARIAYGAFLNEISHEDAALAQWLKAKELDPSDPAVWNNLGDYYGHNGPVTNALIHYAKAIQLNPEEPTYYWNLGTVMYQYRHASGTFLNKEPIKVMDDAMALYRKALQLSPNNFLLSADYAQSFYGFPKPATSDPAADSKTLRQRADLALAAWTNAYLLARDDVERQGVQIHYARWTMDTGRFAESQAALNAVTNLMFKTTKDTLLKKMARMESKATNAPASPSAPIR
ncbi:MAG: hypothetical protein HYR88_09815 [Verrucomicrobia bacterium]|nr:hypothetical protein [Verrucomicrobiota bacterium]MBI3867531.1 hypothetical protein [Verrucomicrobiota bacterium]